MIVAALLLALFQGGSPIVRFDSREQGRTFSVDPDKPEIRQALRDVSAPSPAVGIPEWLPPYPDAREIPHKGTNDPVDFGAARRRLVRRHQTDSAAKRRGNATRVRARHGDNASLRTFDGASTVGSRGFPPVDRVLSERKDRDGKRASGRLAADKCHRHAELEDRTGIDRIRRRYRILL